jgi:hypothetical protein
MVRREVIRRGLVLTLVIAAAAGCVGKRPAQTQAELLDTRAKNDKQNQADGAAALDRVLERTKAKYDADKDKATLEMLIISGGGDWGAFGAGFLKGWAKVPPGPLARPKFDIVTGVSTGALIAPFAYIGTDESIEKVVHLYRNPKKDWVKERWPLYFLPNNISFAEVPGLERELKDNVDMETVRTIATEYTQNNRLLIVNTTNIDDGTMRPWDVGFEAQRAVNENKTDRIHAIMLASSGIPGAFPYREIDGQLYVDGGVTGNILYGGRLKEDQTLPARWKAKYPDLKMPTLRYWVIFNNQTRPLPQVTSPSWTAVVSRALEMATRAATLTAMRHLYAMAEISRLKHGAEIEIRVVHVPNDWVPPKPGVFIKETMNSLADMGEKMGADSSSWTSTPPME